MRRFYLTNAAPPSFDPTTTVKGTWSDTTKGGSSGGLLALPSGTSVTSAQAETNASATWDVILAHWTSDKIGKGFLLGGTVNWVIGTLESSASALFVTKCHIWVSQGATTTLRGTLLNNWVGTNNWPTTAAGLADGTIALTDVQVQQGDFVTVEFGYRATNTSITSFTGTQNFGGTASPDLSNADTNVTTRPSWIEFSTDFLLPHALPNQKLRPRIFGPGNAR